MPGRVFGTLVDEQGDPLAGATVIMTVVDPVTGEVHAINTTTDGRGSFELSGCPDGELTLAVEVNGVPQATFVLTGVRGADLDAGTRTIHVASSPAVASTSTHLAVAAVTTVNNATYGTESAADELRRMANIAEELANSDQNLHDAYQGVLKFWRLSPKSIPSLPPKPRPCSRLFSDWQALEDDRNDLLVDRVALAAKYTALRLRESLWSAEFGSQDLGFHAFYSLATSTVNRLGVIIAVVGIHPAVSIAAAILALIADFDTYADIAQGRLDRMSIALSRIESLALDWYQAVQDFDKKVVALAKKIDDYQKKPGSKIPDIKAPSLAPPPLCVGESASGDLLAPIRDDLAMLGNQVDWELKISGDSSVLSIGANGGFLANGSHCGQFSLKYELIIDCNDGTLWDTKIRSWGTISVVVNPETHPSCGTPPPPGDCEQLVQELNEATGCAEWKIKPVYSAQCGAFDPNDIIGPWGIGEEHWIDSQSMLDYMIRFENDPEKASAPAAVVRITQALDADLDFSTFQLGTMGFGDTVINGAVGKASYQTRLDFLNELRIYVDVSAGIDTATGEAFWEFKSIDPDIGEVPFDPFLGFLPPNKNGSEGQGYVTYSIKPKADASSGTVVDAVAAITFDQNEPIDTPPIFNTLDAGAPTSAVVRLPEAVYPGFLVRWFGEDDEGGSGIGRYDVYVSEGIDGDWGPYMLWLEGTRVTEARYVDAVAGRQYRFYSVGIDNVGNVEDAPAVPDWETTVLEPISVVSVNVVSRPSRVIEIEFSDPMDVQRLIDDGSIVEAVTLLAVPDGSIPLTAGQFAYQSETRTLMLNVNEMLPLGYYELRIDGTQVTSDSGVWLRGDRSGIVFELGTWDEGQVLEAAGVELAVDGFSMPSLADWNSDGLLDLIVGERTADGQGKVRVYLNQGTNESPLFDAFFYAQTATGDLVLPADGCGGDAAVQSSSACSASGCSSAWTSTCGGSALAPLATQNSGSSGTCQGLGVAPRLFDWNGDGLLDLILGLADGHLQVALNENTNSEPRFGEPESIEVGEPGAKSPLHVGGCATFEIVDWNNDGLPDLLVGGLDGRVRLYLNEGSREEPEFCCEVFVQDGGADLVVTGGWAGITAADLNGDGRKDLVLGQANGWLSFYANVGTDSAPAFDGWQPVVADGVEVFLPGLSCPRPFLGDFNNDGILDLLIGASDGLVRLYTGLTPGGPVELTEPIVGTAYNPYVHTFEVVLDTNLRPVIGTLSATPDPVTRPNVLSLTAHDVTDLDGTVERVEFYHGQDLLGEVDGSNGWTLSVSTFGWTTGERTLFARAQDNEGAWSELVSATVTVRAGAPSDLQLSLSAAEIDEWGRAWLSGSFTDPGTLDGHTVTINWDDGSPEQVLDLTPGVTGFTDVMHTFAVHRPHGQSYTIQVTVADEAASTSATISTVWPWYDFGDAPDSYGTLLASNGARHRFGAGLFLGALVDADEDGRPSWDALGDDTHGDADEDGVVFASILRQGQMASVQVTASEAGFLDAFVDFNADGSFADDGEKVFDSVPVAAGENVLNFLIPEDAVSGPTYARFRISAAGGLSFDGPAVDGEVEDKRIVVGLWGDFEPIVPGRFLCKAYNATPGGMVTFAYGTRTGTNPVPQFGVTLNITDPTYFGQGVAGPTGYAAFVLNVPPALLEQPLYVQAFEQTPSAQATDVVVVDDNWPTVAIARAADQAERTSDEAIRFSVQFSKTVYDFNADDLVIGGTAAGELVASLTGSGAVYEVTIHGMTGTGTVTLSVPDGAAHDGAGNPNWASGQHDASVVFLANAWQNYPLAYDVANDGHVRPLDALLVISWLNAYGAGPVPLERPAQSAYVDVDGNGFVTPFDALLVINHLNVQASSDAESESAAYSADPTALFGVGPYPGTSPLPSRLVDTPDTTRSVLRQSDDEAYRDMQSLWDDGDDSPFYAAVEETSDESLELALPELEEILPHLAAELLKEWR